MDTLGSLIDKLATVNQKMFINQEFLYEIREMNYETFWYKYIVNSPNELFDKLKKVIDLNLQRQSLILEIDKLTVQLVKDVVENPEDTSKYIQDQHKTHELKEN